MHLPDITTEGWQKFRSLSICGLLLDDLGFCSSGAASCLNNGHPDPQNCAQCKCPEGLGGTVCHEADVAGSHACLYKYSSKLCIHDIWFRSTSSKEFTIIHKHNFHSVEYMLKHGLNLRGKFRKNFQPSLRSRFALPLNCGSMLRDKSYHLLF